MIELFGKYEGEDDYITFDDDGCLYVSTYSYYVYSRGEMELDKKETRELYEAMVKYYKQEDESDLKEGRIAHG